MLSKVSAYTAKQFIAIVRIIAILRTKDNNFFICASYYYKTSVVFVHINTTITIATIIIITYQEHIVNTKTKKYFNVLKSNNKYAKIASYLETVIFISSSAILISSLSVCT